VCCSVVQCVAVCCSSGGVTRRVELTRGCCSVLQWAAVCCSVLQCVACCSVLQCIAVYCSALQCVAVCCSVLQCVADSRVRNALSSTIKLQLLVAQK